MRSNERVVLLLFLFFFLIKINKALFQLPFANVEHTALKGTSLYLTINTRSIMFSIILLLFSLQCFQINLPSPSPVADRISARFPLPTACSPFRLSYASDPAQREELICCPVNVFLHYGRLIYLKQR